MNQKEEISTEQSILEAAEKEFMEKGYALARTTDIAKMAGVNHAMLHYYFRTKENLFNKVYEEKIKELASSFSIMIDQDLSFLERIKLWIEKHFDFLAENPRLPFFVLSEFIYSNKHPHWFREFFLPTVSEFIGRLDENLQEEIEKGNIQPITSLNLILDIVSLNIFVFIAHPFIATVAGVENDEEKYQQFIQQRKAESVSLIMHRLRPE